MKSTTLTGTPTSTVQCDPTFQTCGVSFQQLHASNTMYAARGPFNGIRPEIERLVVKVAQALAPMAANPTVASVLTALQRLRPAPSVQVTDHAFAMAGVAFGIEADGGCVYGQIYHGRVSVHIGGYISDGGCLALTAH
jgi:hypothetical protein